MKLVNPTVKSAVCAALDNHHKKHGGAEFNPQHPNVKEIASKSGVNYLTIKNYRRGVGNAGYNNLLSIVQACGGRITIEFD